MAHCETSDLLINQTATGALVKGKSQWNVTVTNECPCTQLHVTLMCKGFDTVEPLNTSVIAKSGDLCLLINDEQPIYPFATLSFTYAWDDQFAFKPNSSNVACS
ncbi:uncharacterized protein At1g05835-like [Henckelia pumila]|uniref:uncharacterized protein At1g05835-like n=1 Tax=Henckelia pumila TaxID=405737 RepID=UPI003C6E877D